MKAVNVELDEKAVDAVKYLCTYCTNHPNCKGCFFNFSQVCILKWSKPDGWNHSVEKLMERRKNNANKL